MKKKKQIFIIDFDSTFITTEGLEGLAEMSLADNPRKDAILEQITQLTNKAMNGEMSFKESLAKRLALLTLTEKNIEATINNLQVSPSIKKHTTFFQEHSDDVYIISSGFKELILPIVSDFGISPQHVFANTFVFDKKGNVTGYDTRNPLAQDHGKVKQLTKLALNGDVIMVGDGYTDYEVKKAGISQTFIAFTENTTREKVIAQANFQAASWDEVLRYLTSPPLSFPKEKLSVLILENINQQAIAAFEEEGYAVREINRSLSEEELLKEIEHTSILCIRSRTKITPRVLQKAKRLLAIGIFAIGTNQVDLKAAQAKGIAVFNAPYSNTRSVVELVIGEIIMLMRNVFEKSTKMHQGIWDKSAQGSFEVRGKILGIIGYGNIGTQVGILAEALGMQVCFYDKEEKLQLGNAKQCKSLKELVSQADVVTIHVDGDSKNKHLIDKKVFQQMKDGAFFINASRGFVVDEKALITNLKKGKLAGAALDVFETEPKSNGETFTSDLTQFPNVIITPHIGGSTTEAQTNIAHFVSQKVIDFINTGSTSLSVNMPIIQLPQQRNSHRFLHLHHNVPGVLAQITTIFATHQSNILGQYLKTDTEVGYVITDINTPYDAEIVTQLKQISETIRFRVLY